MLLQSLARPLPGVVQNSGTPAVPGGTYGELMCSEVNPLYYSLVKSGRVFTQSGLNIPLNSFGGNGLSSPSFSLFNPTDNTVDAVILSLRIVMRQLPLNTQCTFGWYSGVAGGASATIGTPASPMGGYAYSLGGSSVLSQVNGPITFSGGNGLLSLIAPSLTLGNTGSASAPTYGVYVDETRGVAVATPGTMLCWGVIAGGGAGTGFFDMTITWAELAQ